MMKEYPLVSIIVPCYNKGEFIGKTLQSVINQTYLCWECLIIDDGSTDNSKEICIDYCMKDSRVHYYHKSNSGVADARNYGIEISRGEYLLFLDADDLLDSRKLEITYKYFCKYPKSDVVYSSYHYSYENGEKQLHLKTSFRKRCANNAYYDLLRNWDSTIVMPIHCSIFKKSLLIDNHIRFDNQLCNKEDWDFILQVAKVTSSFRFIPVDLVTYVLVTNSRSNKSNLTMMKGVDEVLLKHYISTFSICEAIAYNLSFRKVRNVLIRLLGRKEPKESLTSYIVFRQKNIRILSYVEIPIAFCSYVIKILRK